MCTLLLVGWLMPCAARTAQCTNTSDCTADLLAALNSCENVDIPPLPGSMPWIVTPLHIVCSNQRITLHTGTVVEAKRGAFKGLGDHLLHLDSVSNISIVG